MVHLKHYKLFLWEVMGSWILTKLKVGDPLEISIVKRVLEVTNRSYL